MAFDLLDRKIISILQRDGRASSAHIARQLGVSDRTVCNRIKRLVKRKAIFPTVVVNPSHFGYQTAVDIFCEVELAQIETFGNALAQLPEVNYLAYSTGDQDISVQALLSSSEEIHQFIQRLSVIPGIRRTRTVLVPRILKSVHEWIPPESAFKPISNNEALLERAHINN